MRLYPDEFLRIPIICPPVDEQLAIVHFLRFIDSRVRRFIGLKREVLRLLEEQKRGIVNRCLTKGLDPGVQFKPSGIDWIPEIPIHWEVRRAKAVCTSIIDCRNRTPEEVDGGQFTVVRTTCIRNGKFDSSGGFTTDSDNFALWTSRGAPKIGDVFFTREAPAGEACLVPPRDDLCMGQRMMYLRPNRDLVDPRFLLLNIYGPLTRTYVELTTNGSTVGHLRLGEVHALPILWCSLEEQRSIIDHVESESSRIDLTRDLALQEISLLHELRTRLINDVVTGKIDVRELAASLPAVIEEADAPLDEELAYESEDLEQELTEDEMVMS